MVWGAIKQDGTKVLIRCPDRMDSNAYKNVLKKGLLPIYKAHNIFQHDGASCHQSRLVSSFLDSSMICVLSDWPAQSPDLNIILPLWSQLKARISSCKPRNHKIHPLTYSVLVELSHVYYFNLLIVSVTILGIV